jgi:hypothetical protein
VPEGTCPSGIFLAVKHTMREMGMKQVKIADIIGLLKGIVA